jgi:hypothetical protein
MGGGHFVAPKTLEVRMNDGGTRVLAGDHAIECAAADPPSRRQAKSEEDGREAPLKEAGIRCARGPVRGR